jgi:hypothetical protein
MIVSDRDKCYNIAKDFYSDKNLLLECWDIKRTLNTFFNPDEYLFFLSKKNLIPLVVKDGCAYFFGGDLPFNECNSVGDDRGLVDEALSYLKSRDLNFRLTSLKNDPFCFLSKENVLYDVPYNQLWIYPNVNKFNTEEFIYSYKKKTRDKLKRALGLYNRLEVVEPLQPCYKKEYHDKIYELYIKSFKSRGKINCWAKRRVLYDAIFSIMHTKNILKNRVVLDKATKEIVASYSLAISNNEIFLAFSNCYNFDIRYLQFFIYIDILQTSSSIYKSSLFINAGRGSFGYKKRLGFQPQPMYALVKDDRWKKQYNKDITPKETRLLYGRDFGCFL